MRDLPLSATIPELTLVTRRIANITLIEEDLASTDPVPFVAMLKALAQRRHELSTDDKIDLLPISELARAERKHQLRAEAERLAKNDIISLLNEAVKFCNAKSSASQSFRAHIRDM